MNSILAVIGVICTEIKPHQNLILCSVSSEITRDGVQSEIPDEEGLFLMPWFHELYPDRTVIPV